MKEIFLITPKIVERVSKDGEIIVDGVLAYDIYYYKPYLRPLSSITTKEFEEYDELFNSSLDAWTYVDWMNEHHFDYRDLISMGLALEAPEGMYKTKLN